MESSSTNVHIAGEDLLRVFYKLICLQFCVSSDQWKYTVSQILCSRLYVEFERDFYMKIIVCIIPTILFINSLLSFFYPFIETKNNFTFCLQRVALYFRGMPNSVDFYKRIFVWDLKSLGICIWLILNWMLVSVLLDDLMEDLIAVVCHRQVVDLNFMNYFDNSCTLLPPGLIKLLY